MSLVLDASVALAWAFEDQESESAGPVLTHLISETALVPSLWPLEVANGLLAAERRNRIDQSAVTRFLMLLDALEIEIDRQTPERSFNDTLALARQYRLSAYDAAYLELALRTGARLATLDRRLSAAACAAGVQPAL